MKKYQRPVCLFLFAIMFFSLLLSGCAETPGGHTYEAFLKKVKNAAQADATYCGLVEVNGKTVGTNNCVVNFYTSGFPFYAIYNFYGIDSFASHAIYNKSNGELRFALFDTHDFGGQEGDRGKINRYECENPQFSGSLDVSSLELFNCN